MSAEILLADARRLRAMVDVDLAALKVLIADDCRYVHSGGSVDTKTSYLDKLERAVFRYTTLEVLDPVHIHLEGGLVISHRMQGSIVMGGATRPYLSQAVAVWRSSSNGPQLVYFQATTLPPPP